MMAYYWILAFMYRPCIVVVRNSWDSVDIVPAVRSFEVSCILYRALDEIGSKIAICVLLFRGFYCRV